ncbi:7tm 6 domain containing protein, partial [Asbolus verrucosus]
DEWQQLTFYPLKWIWFGGLHPDYNSRLATLHFCFNFSYFGLILVLAVIEILVSFQSNVYDAIESILTIFLYLHIMGKYAVLHFHKSTLACLLTKRSKFWKIRDFDDAVREDCRNITKTALTFIKAYLTYSCLVASSFLVQPFITGQLPVLLYVPKNWYFFLACSFWYLTPSIVASIWGVDTTFYAVSTPVIVQFKLLASRFERLNFGSSSTEEMSVKVKKELKELVDYHNFLLWYSQEINRMFSGIFLVQFLVAIAISCMQLFIASQGQFELGNKIKCLSYFIMQIVETGIYCFTTEAISENSENIGNAVYQSSWYETAGNTAKRDILPIINRAQKRIVFRGFGLVWINMETFTRLKIRPITYLSCYKFADCIPMEILAITGVGASYKDNVFLAIEDLQTVFLYVHIVGKYTNLYFKKSTLSLLLNQKSRFWKPEDFDEDIRKQCERMLTITSNFVFYFIIITILVVLNFFLQPILTGALPVSVYVPSGWFHYINLILWCLVPCIVSSIYGSDVLFCSICVHLIIQFELLAYKFGNQKLQILDNKQKFKQELKEMVDHQNFLTEYCKQFNRYSSTVLLNQVLMSTAIICMQLFVVSQKEFFLSNKLKCLAYCVVDVVETAVYCFNTEMLTDAAEKVGDAAYNSPWYEIRLLETRKDLNLVMARAQNRIVFSGCGLVWINLKTFTQIFKTTLSFYSYLNTMVAYDKELRMKVDHQNFFIGYCREINRYTNVVFSNQVCLPTAIICMQLFAVSQSYIYDGVL